MNKVSADCQLVKPATQQVEGLEGHRVWFKKLRGGFLLVIGYLLSPLSFWNDLFFNLPLAYGFGYLCSLFSPDWLLPGAIAGYWLSNLAGILLMQVGAIDVFQGQPQKRNLKKELFMGVVSSSIYSLIIAVLIQWKVLEMPVLFPQEGLNFSSLLPWGLIKTFFGTPAIIVRECINNTSFF